MSLQALSLRGKVHHRGLIKLEVVSSSFAKESANDLPTVPLQHNLTLEGVLFLFARIELALTPLGALNWRFSHIHYYYLRFAKSSQQLFFACQAKLSTAHQMVLDESEQCGRPLPHSPPNYCRCESRCGTLAPIPGTPGLDHRALTWV